MKKQKIYFASDFHLGVPDKATSLEREKKVIRWLDMARQDAQAIYLLGDLFDFWFEYKTVVPKGYVRLLGKLAEIHDSGIELHVFTGNHDMWMFDYLPTEIGINIHRTTVIRTFGNKKFMIGHGDGLGPGDHGYKLIKKIFSNKAAQWLFARLHPNLGIGLANYWSARSRAATGHTDEKFLGEEKEWLVLFAKEMLKSEHYDYFVFGHRHLPLNIDLGSGSRYVNLGDWLKYYTYAEFDGSTLELKKFEE